jgi:hypothetical protein
LYQTKLFYRTLTETTWRVSLSTSLLPKSDGGDAP